MIKFSIQLETIIILNLYISNNNNVSDYIEQKLTKLQGKYINPICLLGALSCFITWQWDKNTNMFRKVLTII